MELIAQSKDPFHEEKATERLSTTIVSRLPLTMHLLIKKKKDTLIDLFGSILMVTTKPALTLYSRSLQQQCGLGNTATIKKTIVKLGAYSNSISDERNGRGMGKLRVCPSLVRDSPCPYRLLPTAHYSCSEFFTDLFSKDHLSFLTLPSSSSSASQLMPLPAHSS